MQIPAIAAPNEEQLLMAASRANINEAIAHECNRIAPDYWRAYEAIAKPFAMEVLEPMGVTRAIREKAAKIPEVAPSQYVTDFQSNAPEQQLRTCLQVLIDTQGGLSRARPSAQR
jgi:hypothetical protein